MKRRDLQLLPTSIQVLPQTKRWKMVHKNITKKPRTFSSYQMKMTIWYHLPKNQKAESNQKKKSTVINSSSDEQVSKKRKPNKTVTSKNAMVIDSSSEDQHEVKRKGTLNKTNSSSAVTLISDIEEMKESPEEELGE